MTTTVNISLPREMYKDAKRVVKEKKYASISELVREGMRKVIYDESEIWETGEDVKRYFRNLREDIKVKHDKGQKIG